MLERLPALIGDSARQIVHKALCCLLEGIPCTETVHAAAKGPWAESICAMVAAHTQGGQPAVRHMFAVLARQNPDLTALLTAPDESQPRVWTFQNLYHTSFPPPQFLLPDLLPVGLTILAGRPKIGKSWLAMQIAAAVGTGSTLFGRTAQQGPVLYLALEDTPGRIKDRGQKQGIPETATIIFHMDWAPLSRNGMVDLVMAAYSGYRLIIIDTFNRTLDNADPMDTKEMTLLFSELQRLAGQHNLAILLIDHHRKPGLYNSDLIDDVFGSTAKAGIVDAVWGLYKQRSDISAVLKVTGRDICEQELNLSWDASHCLWQIQDAYESTKFEQTQRQKEILAALDDSNSLTLSDVAIKTGQNRSNCLRRLQMLVQNGDIQRSDDEGRIIYKRNAKTLL